MKIIYKSPENIVGHKKYVADDKKTASTNAGLLTVCSAAGKWKPECADGKMYKELTEISEEMIAALNELAKRMVPKGSKYKIVEDSDLPTSLDSTFRNAWDISDSELTDGIGVNKFKAGEE